MAARSDTPRGWILTVAVTALVLVLTGAPARAQCVGDCNGNGSVEINELIIGVNIALGNLPVSQCPSFDCDNTGTVPINCLIQGVNNALNGCPTGNCPLQAGAYTVTQQEGGMLMVSTATAFPFPAGGTIIEDVKAANEPNCI